MDEELALGKRFWDIKYISNQIGWDMGEVSPPIKEYIDQIENKDLAILIPGGGLRSEEHTSELQSRPHLVCRLLLEKKKWPNTNSLAVGQRDPQLCWRTIARRPNPLIDALSDVGLERSSASDGCVSARQTLTCVAGV